MNATLKNKTKPKYEPPTNRRDERFLAKFPIVLGDEKGATRDLSASGIYFEIENEHKTGTVISFLIDLDTPGGKIKVACEAEVVRVEKLSGKCGIAARIIKQEFLSTNNETN